MKKILIILLMLCLILSFTVPSYASYSTESYLIFFKTKDSYENTEYEELFSDHKNFLDPSALGMPELSHISVFGASYGTNSDSNTHFYIMCAEIGFSTLREATEACTELMSRGIAERVIMANENVELMRGEPEIAIRKLAIPIMISMLLIKDLICFCPLNRGL